ncbi:SAM-dependent chlorinase/fluorinase [Candidatus Poribacteria bacterium]|nr:SAM-dependent chlorinase/fluorinase [Candidatus Poribacteria bacterium]
MITLTTDFGTSDLYVGVMKGVILSINPRAQIIDMTHAIPPQDVYAAAFLIDSAYRYFPTGTIHVVVVDPGVGSRRHAIACQTETATFVCPDNGVLTHILRDERLIHAVTVENPPEPPFTKGGRGDLPQISNTFHGRDIFAPVAAHLSRGVPITDLGTSITELVRLPIPTPQVTDTAIIGHVIWRDHFGNLITNISHQLLKSVSMPNGFVIQAGTVEIDHLNCSYAESGVGEFLAIIGSFGRLEVSMNQGNAAQRLGLKRGDAITVRFSPSPCRGKEPE